MFYSTVSRLVLLIRLILIWFWLELLTTAGPIFSKLNKLAPIVSLVFVFPQFSCQKARNNFISVRMLMETTITVLTVMSSIWINLTTSRFLYYSFIANVRVVWLTNWTDNENLCKPSRASFRLFWPARKIIYGIPHSCANLEIAQVVKKSAIRATLLIVHEIAQIPLAQPLGQFRDSLCNIIYVYTFCFRSNSTKPIQVSILVYLVQSGLTKSRSTIASFIL